MTDITEPISPTDMYREEGTEMIFEKIAANLRGFLGPLEETSAGIEAPARIESLAKKSPPEEPTEMHQVVVPGMVIDELYQMLKSRGEPCRVWFGMAVMLGKTEYTIAEAVEELRTWEADGIWSPEASVIESPLKADEVRKACIDIYFSDEFAAERSKYMAEQTDGSITTWSPDEISEGNRQLCHKLQDMAVAGEQPEQRGLWCADTVAPVAGGWLFPGRIEGYNYITDGEMTPAERRQIQDYVYGGPASCPPF